MPVGLMQNRNPESEAFESEEALDGLMLIRGTVKGFYHGVLELGDQSQNAYLRCIIETQFGDLEIVHTLDVVRKEQRVHLRAGATVYGVFRLSGDAAIYEYERGMVLGETHDLAILRATLAGADPERLRYALAENAVYLAGYQQKTYTGRDAIIRRLKEVLSKNDRCFARLATIVSVDPGKEALPYGEGKRCIVIAYGEDESYTTIAFADIDEEGRICRLETSEENRYHFCLEGRPEL